MSATDIIDGRFMTLRFYPYKLAIGVGLDWWPERYVSVRLLVGPFMLIGWLPVLRSSRKEFAADDG